MQEQKRDGKQSFWRTLFDDLSIAQLLAGALAAVTSMLLASRIGIAGSLIGAAVGSIVSAVASQVYKKFLSASAEKIKDIAPTHASSGGETAHEEPLCAQRTVAMGALAENGVVSAASVAKAETVAIEALESGVSTSDLGKTVALNAVKPGEASVTKTSSDVSASAPSPESKLYAESALARARAARERKAKIQKSAVIVAAVSALLAMLLSAVVIEVVTAGQGVGTKTPPIVASWHDPLNAAEKAQNADGASQNSSASAPSEEPLPSDSSSTDASQQGSSSGKDESSSSSGSNAGSTEGDSINTQKPSSPDGSATDKPSSGGSTGQENTAPDTSGGGNTGSSSNGSSSSDGSASSGSGSSSSGGGGSSQNQGESSSGA